MKNEKKIASFVPATATRFPSRSFAILHATSWLILSLCLPLLSQSKAGKFPTQNNVAKQSDKPIRATLNTNEWSYWVLWDGQSGRNPYTGDSGGLFPDQSISGVFADGLMWAGIVDDPNSNVPLRAGGSTYISGYLPGRILASGEPQDPSDPDVRLWRILKDVDAATDEALLLDAAETYNIPEDQVTLEEIQALRDEYRFAWENWPGQWGAPYIDVNENGVWDRGIDMPGIPGFKQMIWIVSNDLDSETSRDFTGSPSMGLEIQSTFWTMENPVFDDMVFRRTRLVNRSTFQINDMYFGIWTDIDLGNFGNDLAGSDSLANLAYVWNGTDIDDAFDEKKLPPAAIGYHLLQGPIVADPSGSAIVDFLVLPGFRNLDILGLTWQRICPICDPPLGDYNSTLGWFNRLRGYTPTFDIENPTPYLAGSGPERGQPIRLKFSGDPVADPMGNLGDVDGNGDNLPPGDRRFSISTGPFTIASGGMQEIVYVLIGAVEPGGDRYSSITRLKSLADLVSSQYPRLDRIPRAAIKSDHSTATSTLDIQIDAKDRVVQSATVILRDSRKEQEELQFPLFNDGQHDDSLAGDNLWATGQLTVDNRRYPHELDVIFQTDTGTVEIPGLLGEVRLRPEISIINVEFDWENGRQDLVANHGETIQLAYQVFMPDDRHDVQRLIVNGAEIGGLDFNGSYSGSSSELRFVATAPALGDKLIIPYQISYDYFEATGSLVLPIQVWKPTTLWKDTLSVDIRSGFSINLTPVVADASLITGDQYEVEFFEDLSDSQTVWRLKNMNSGEVLLNNQPTMQGLYADFPIIDGIQFQVNGPPRKISQFQAVANAAGAIEPPVQGAFAFNRNGFPTHDGLPLTPGVNDRPDASRQQTNGSTWGFHTGGTNRSLYETFLSRVLRNDNVDRALPFDFELRFTEAGGYAYWGFESEEMGEVPFELWNIGIDTPNDPSDDYRMIPWVLNDADFDTGPEIFNINALDHSVSGANNDPYTDWIYWRDPADKTPGDAGYQAFVEDGLAGIYVPRDNAEVMARTVLVNWNGGDVSDPTFPQNVDAVMPEAGTVFRIITNKPNYPGDRLLVDTAPVFRPELFYPVSFFLDQNYPNPFNPETSIEFALPEAVDVKLEVFNVLGQRVKTLMDESLEPAKYRIIWDGIDSNGIQVASGIYFYRISAGRFVKTRKMILLH